MPVLLVLLVEVAINMPVLFSARVIRIAESTTMFL